MRFPEPPQRLSSTDSNQPQSTEYVNERTYIRKRNLILGCISPLLTLIICLIVGVIAAIVIHEQPLAPPTFTATVLDVKSLLFPSFCPSEVDMSCCTPVCQFQILLSNNSRGFNSGSNFTLDIMMDVVIQNVNFNPQLSWNSSTLQIYFDNSNNLIGTSTITAFNDSNNVGGSPIINNLNGVVMYTFQQQMQLNSVDTMIYWKYLCSLNANRQSIQSSYLTVQGKLQFDGVVYGGEFPLKMDWLMTMQVIDLNILGICNAENAFCIMNTTLAGCP